MGCETWPFTTPITAAAMASLTEGKLSESSSPDAAPLPAHDPVAIRAATSPTTMASTTASTASSVMRGRRDTSGATSMIPVHRTSRPIRNAQTGRSQSGNVWKKLSSERSSGPAGCAATMPASASANAPRPTMSVARRTRT